MPDEILPLLFYCPKLPLTVVHLTMTGLNGSISEEITGEGYDVRTKLIHMNTPERV